MNEQAAFNPLQAQEVARAFALDNIENYDVTKQPERFARGFTTILIEYALGRPNGFGDEPLTDAIVAALETDRTGPLREIMA